MQIASVESRVGNADLRRAVEDSVDQAFFQSVQMAFDVFNHDRRVIDQDSHRQGESAEGHGVQRLAHAVHDQNRRNDG